MIKFIKGWMLIMISIFGILGLGGCSSSNKINKDLETKTSASSNSNKKDNELVSLPQNDVVISTENLPIATVKVKDYGDMVFELYPKLAPNTVNNFISLANKGFYNNLTFHRIISDFMIQGGDPNGNGTGGPGYSIKDELPPKFDNKLKHKVGIISMANSGPDSSGSQFFIMTKDAPWLDGKHTAFGRIILSLDVLSKIKDVKVGAQDKPTISVVMESVTVDTKGEKYEAPITNLNNK